MRFRKTVLCAWLAMLVPSATSAQAPATLDALLALTPSPGADALLVLHAADPLVPQRWREALEDPDASRRTAAARMIGATASRTVIGGLRAAALDERDPVVLGEMLRALVIIGSDASDGLVYRRAGDVSALAASRLAVTLAAVRPSGLVTHLLAGGHFAQRADVVAAVQARLLTAAPEEAARLEQGASAASPRVLAGLLRVGLATRHRLAPTLVVAALRADEDASIDALRYLSRTYEKPSTAAADATLVEAYGASRGSTTTVTPLHAFLLALADRWIVGATSDLTPAIEGLRADDLDGLGLDAGVLVPLTRQELRAVEERVGPHRDPKTAATRASLEEIVARNRWRQPFTDPGLMLTDVPPSLVLDVARLTGCKATSSDALGLVITHRADGRVQGAALHGAALSPPCLQMAQVVLSAAYGPPALPGAAQARTVVRLDDPWWSCIAGADDAPAPTAIANRRRVQLEKAVDRKPLYPQEALAKRIQGVVIMEATISAAGCVTEARIMRSIPQLDLHALIAVSHWRYEPFEIDGEARPVQMTVTINFQLQ